MQKINIDVLSDKINGLKDKTIAISVSGIVSFIEVIDNTYAYVNNHLQLLLGNNDSENATMEIDLNEVQSIECDEDMTFDTCHFWLTMNNGMIVDFGNM